jgi:predicted RNA binding protein YcfA (HicA-like mRNA interferase family)
LKNKVNCTLANTTYILYAKTVNGKHLIKLLEEKGWKIDRIEGSHHILAKGNKTLSVPVHGSKDLGKGLLNALMKQGGLK